MPQCVKCKQQLECNGCHEPQPVGQSANGCTLKKGALWIHVTDDQGKDINNVPAKKDEDAKDTKDGGLAVFDPLDSGPYTAKLPDTLAKPISDDYDLPDEPQRKREVTVTDGAIAYANLCLNRKAELTVKVVSKDGTKLFEKATVKMVTGKEKKPDGTTAATGIADFAKVSAGKYTLKAELDAAEDAKKFATTKDFSQVDVTEDAELAVGEKKEVPIQAEPINFVVPKIELEYKVVLLDRKLSDHQDGGETKIYADPTYIQVSVTQSKKDDHPFAKEGKLSATPENVDFFTDEECKTKLDRKLTKEELTAGTPTKIYLRGKTAGKFKVKLELDDPADRFVKRAEADTLKEKTFVEEEMGVVEIKMEVYWQDQSALDGITIDPDVDPIGTYHTALKDKVLPDQKALTDEQKVKEGRLLHAQTDGHFGRAKLVVKQLTAAQWPDVPADYVVYLMKTYVSGSVEVFDAEVDGAEKKLPVEMKVSDLLNAEKVLWVQGLTEVSKVNDIRLELSLDRDPGGLAKESKRYADWARFTVVKIKEVNFEVTVPSGKPTVWDDGRKRFYINTDADPDGRTLKTKTGDREIKVTATLTKKLKDIDIHFMLVPDPANGTGGNLPGTWKHQLFKKALKHKDKADRQKLLHVSAKTDADGVAKTEDLVLSRFGGDKFTIGAYIKEDPHLAKYVENHTDLGKRKPVLWKEKLQVWRGINYQFDAMVAIDGKDYSGPRKPDDVKAEYEKHFVNMNVAAQTQPANRRAIANEKIDEFIAANFGALRGKPRTVYVGLVDTVGGTPRDTATNYKYTLAGGASYDQIVPSAVIDCSDRALWLSGVEICEKTNAGWQPWQPFDQNKLTLVPNGQGHDYKLTIDLTSYPATGTFCVGLFIVTYGAVSGLAAADWILIDMRHRYKFNYVIDPSTLNTVIHEIGHYLGLSAPKHPDEADTANTDYDTPKGNHCKHGGSNCAMWFQGQSAVTGLCPVCGLATRVRNLNTPPIWGANAY